MIKLALLLYATIFTDSTTSLEQKASDFFFSNIFKEQYGDYKVVEFDNQTDTTKYWGVVHKCENLDAKTKGLIVSATPDKSMEVTPSSPDIRIKKIKKNSNRLKIYVYSKVKAGDNYFVLIGAYRKLRFAEYYFIKFDKAGNVVDTCKQGEII